MLKKLLSSLFFTFLLTTTAIADQLIIEPDMGRAPILSAIQSAQHSLKLVMYGFTDKTLLEAIIKQKQQGRTVNVILEKSPYKIPEENAKTIAAFQDNHINWIGTVTPFRLIHQKTLLIDNHEAIVMTFNFTNSSFKKTRNFGLILKDPKDIKEIGDFFSADWNQQPITGHDAHLIWSPDDSREKIIAILKKAKRSINMYAQTVNDYKIVGELAKAARRGVIVNILTSNKPNAKLGNYLEKSGIHLRRDNHYYIHAKAMLIDNQQAIIGSINLTRASLDDNRELSVITEDTTVIKQLNNIFNQDWNESA